MPITSLLKMGYMDPAPGRQSLGPRLDMSDAILEEDKHRPAKQRHTAKRIFDRLRAEYGFTAGYTIVKDNVRLHQQRSQEMRKGPWDHSRRGRTWLAFRKRKRLVNTGA